MLDEKSLDVVLRYGVDSTSVSQAQGGIAKRGDLQRNSNSVSMFWRLPND